MSSDFVHLHVHSFYSLLYGTASPEDIVKQAKELGYTSLALTDINNLYGVHDFIGQCRKYGLRPVTGTELRAGGERAVVLARDREGFSNICRLISSVKEAQDIELYRELQAHSRGTVILTDSPRLLEALNGRTQSLYAMVTPLSQGAALTARRLGIPLAASGEVNFLREEDYEIHRLLRAIERQGLLSETGPEHCAPGGSLLFSPMDAFMLFPNFREALHETARIAESCEFQDIFTGFVFPSCGGLDTKSTAAELRRRVYEGAEKSYGELSETVTDRIEYEMEIIEEKGFAPYFLVVGDIVSRASRTCGRGSAAASIVSYSLGITSIDPIEHGLYFERFLNPQRQDPPDIDVDFAWDERDAIIEDVMERHGRDNSAMVCTMIHYRVPSALRDTARAFGIPDTEISAVQEGLLRGRISANVMDEVWKDVLQAALRIKGFPKHLSVHVGGLVITPGPLRDLVPVERAAKGVPVITWDKDGAEEAGLVKIDLLGNRSLAVVRDALQNCAENGITIDRYAWDPLKDPATQALLARGDSMGVFYVESPAMRQLQAKTGAGDFGHIVIASSIIRPAANRYINEYVDRLKGKPWSSPHPALDHILKETFGIMCYQEDVSKVAIALADFSPAEADGLRKILTKKNREEKLEIYRKQFFSGALKKGVRTPVIEELWKMILSFDGYSFCKPHSASYAMVSFQSAWLKAHHGAEFIAAVLSNGGGYYTASAYISEARRMGLTVTGPDINESDWKFRGRGVELRVGLMALKGLRYETARAIVDARNRGGMFTGIEELMRRVNIPPSDCEILVCTGTLDSIAGGLNRPRQLWKMIALAGENTPGGEALLFGAATVKVPALPDLPLQERLRQEYASLGFLCSHHPLVLWHRETVPLRRNGVRGRDLPRLVGRKVSIVGWTVTRKAVLTSGGQAMEFISFEDETAIFETVFFPEAYRRYAHLIVEDAPFLLEGRVDSDRGAVTLQVERLERIRREKAESGKTGQKK